MVVQQLQNRGLIRPCRRTHLAPYRCRTSRRRACRNNTLCHLLACSRTGERRAISPSGTIYRCKTPHRRSLVRRRRIYHHRGPTRRHEATRHRRTVHQEALQRRARIATHRQAARHITSGLRASYRKGQHHVRERDYFANSDASADCFNVECWDINCEAGPCVA